MEIGRTSRNHMEIGPAISGKIFHKAMKVAQKLDSRDGRACSSSVVGASANDVNDSGVVLATRLVFRGEAPRLRTA